MIEAGHSDNLGATVSGDGVNFAVHAPRAEAMELVLLDRDGNETATHRLTAKTDDVWHGFLPGCRAGQTYGYRAHGPYAPDQGLRFNPAKLLLDPYTREIRGELIWRPEVFDYTSFEPMRGLKPSPSDNAPFVPKACVRGPAPERTKPAPRTPWADTVIYEANVRGYTMLHPAVNEADRGTFRGMRHKAVLAYLKALGITAVELMPVHAFVDEEFLVAHGLRNYWGYNTLGFFAPAGRLAGPDPVSDFVEMVDAIHDAGLEVILDVVYNHTAEGGRLGPTLSFRGLDNPGYYRLLHDDRSSYVNDTGVGNTIDADQPVVRRLVIDSLRYWHREMGVDGFRFDLAPILGRHAGGFDPAHPLFAEIEADAGLAGARLIAEPWDVGPGGYRLGGFPPRWSEWNDRFRDAIRQFWRADAGLAPEFARRIHGSADLFDHPGRGPRASVNFVAAHDGFTLADCVSYSERHNEANGEHNRDGHAENYSCNYLVEGPTDDTAIVAARRRHRLNLLASLLFAQGTPMLLAGDEFGNSQHGNNNAFAQDNEIGWLDWPRAPAETAFTDAVRRLIETRRRLPLLRQTKFRHGRIHRENGLPDIFWFRPDGAEMTDADWHSSQQFGLVLTDESDESPAATQAVILIFNGSDFDSEFTLPPLGTGGVEAWQLEIATSDLDDGALPARPGRCQGVCRSAARSVVCLSLIADKAATSSG